MTTRVEIRSFKEEFGPSISIVVEKEDAVLAAEDAAQAYQIVVKRLDK